MPGDERAGWFQQWESLYGQLLDNSRKQLETVREIGEFERMEALLNDLFAEWEQVKQRISRLETRMRDEVAHDVLSSRFREKILPLAEQLQKNMDQTAVLFREKILSAGRTIQTARERKMASEAYYATDHDVHEALFFDEKN